MKYQYIIFSRSLQNTYIFFLIKVNGIAYHIVLTAFTHNIKFCFVGILKNLQISMDRP
jgi:hypothetical protein